MLIFNYGGLLFYLATVICYIIYLFHFTRATASDFLSSLATLFSYGIAAIAPFSHRLAFDNMPEDVQRLRCKVNFHALTFVPHINALGDALVKRLRRPIHSSMSTGGGYLREMVDELLDRETGKFVALHLRFDKVSY